MLTSVNISRRQSEIRQELATLAGKDSPSEDETRRMDELDTEYRSNETRYRAALIAEDTERRDARDELERRGGNEWAELVGRFELRQIALALDEGRALDGATAEVVAEMRSKGGYRGFPVPLEALETRTGETVASGTPDPIRTMPIVDRIFADSIAARMGCQIITIDAGDVEYPVTTSSVTAGWQATETGGVSGPTAFAATDRTLAPNNTLGIQMKVTRRALKQSGAGLEAAIRRDMAGTIADKLDDAAFNGSGASGQPLGVIAGASTYGITETSAGAPTWADFRAAIARFMAANAVGGPAAVKVGIRPETWNTLDGTLFDSGSGVTELDRLMKFIPAGNLVTSTHMTDNSTSPVTYKALLTTVKNGVAPFVCGIWGGVDVIRDPYSDAASGGLRLTGLVTADFAVLRPAQLEVLTGIS